MVDFAANGYSQSVLNPNDFGHLPFQLILAITHLRLAIRGNKGMGEGNKSRSFLAIFGWVESVENKGKPSPSGSLLFLSPRVAFTSLEQAERRHLHGEIYILCEGASENASIPEHISFTGRFEIMYTITCQWR